MKPAAVHRHPPPAAPGRRVRYDNRSSDLAAIHIAAKSLGWSEEEYRDIMATVCSGVRSAALLDASGRKRLLAHMQACQRANRPEAATRTERKPLTRTQAKMWSLWMQLADAGLVQQRTMAALNAFVKRQTQVDRLQWLNGAQEELVLESMKRWLRRAGGPDDGTQG